MAKYIVQRLETILLSWEVEATSVDNALEVFDTNFSAGLCNDPDEECLGTEPHCVVGPDGISHFDDDELVHASFCASRFIGSAECTCHVAELPAERRT